LLSLSRTSLLSSEVKSFGNSIVSLPLLSLTSFSGLFQRWRYSTSTSLFCSRNSMYREGEASRSSYQLFVCNFPYQVEFFNSKFVFFFILFVIILMYVYYII